MQGFMAQFARAIKETTTEKYWKPHDLTSGARKRRNSPIEMGSQHTANPSTIAMDIFKTFRSLC